MLVKDEIKDYYGAISDYNKAIEIHPADVDSHLNKTMSNTTIGDVKDACKIQAK